MTSRRGSRLPARRRRPGRPAEELADQQAVDDARHGRQREKERRTEGGLRDGEDDEGGEGGGAAAADQWAQRRIHMTVLNLSCHGRGVAAELLLGSR